MRARAGFTLVEVLVALFVVALGIAGAAGLQTLALRAARDAARLSDGSMLLASLAERMRANPVAMALADADNPYLQLDFDAGDGAPAATVSCHAAGDCAPAELARFDTFEAGEAAAARFPGARLLVCRDAAPVDAASGLPRWACAGGAGAPVVAKLGWSDGGDPAEAAAAPRLVLVVAGDAS